MESGIPQFAPSTGPAPKTTLALHAESRSGNEFPILASTRSTEDAHSPRPTPSSPSHKRLRPPGEIETGADPREEREETLNSITAPLTDAPDREPTICEEHSNRKSRPATPFFGEEGSGPFAATESRVQSLVLLL
jgi:hypothetical protein